MTIGHLAMAMEMGFARGKARLHPDEAWLERRPVPEQRAYRSAYRRGLEAAAELEQGRIEFRELGTC